MNGRQLFGLTFTAVLASSSCISGDPILDPLGEELCSLNPSLLSVDLPPDAIPALTQLTMVDPDSPDLLYLEDRDRVLGVVIHGEARAYPHNILWHHEIVNDVIDGVPISVTYCPLTGSGLAFNPLVDGVQLDLGVSGLLFANNLVMFDRIGGDVFGPQLSRSGECAIWRDKTLELMPVQEMSWGRWRGLYPNTTVVSSETGHGRNYRVYPYGSYAELFNNQLLFPMGVDETRSLKERVLVIRLSDTGGRGYPFGELEHLGEVGALNELVGGIPTAIFYEARDGHVANAFDARVGGQTLTFESVSAGMWRDVETGSTWGIDGVATSGPHQGARLTERSDSFVVFWFAWRHFLPDGDTCLN